MRLRAEYAVIVWVRCGACHRILGRLYGSQREPVAFDNGQVSGLLLAGARIDYFRRHPSCPADSPADWAKLSAASTLAIAPILIMGWFSQRQLVRGLTFGAVK